MKWRSQLFLTTSWQMGGWGGGQDIFQGRGKDPQKVIGFDHFVQEKSHFFLISLKVGGGAEGQDTLQAIAP